MIIHESGPVIEIIVMIISALFLVLTVLGRLLRLFSLKVNKHTAKIKIVTIPKLIAMLGAKS